MGDVRVVTAADRAGAMKLIDGYENDMPEDMDPHPERQWEAASLRPGCTSLSRSRTAAARPFAGAAPHRAPGGMPAGNTALSGGQFSRRGRPCAPSPASASVAPRWINEWFDVAFGDRPGIGVRQPLVEPPVSRSLGCYRAQALP
jgi:hypothetical protein